MWGKDRDREFYANYKEPRPFEKTKLTEATISSPFANPNLFPIPISIPIYHNQSLFWPQKERKSAVHFY